MQFHEDTSMTVTLHELQHVVPKEARAEMEKAERAKLKHDAGQELDHLKKAVRIDPEFIAARNNLGICLLENEPASAITQWEEAIKIDPHNGLLFNNLAVGYVLAHNLEAAERAARMSIELDRTTNRARALLGLVLYQRHKYTEEALTLLERACDDYPTTHVFVAQLLVRRGEFQKARTHVQAYLSGGYMDHREDASRMLDFIDQTSTSSQELVAAHER